MLKIDWNTLFCSTSISPVPGIRKSINVNQRSYNGKNDCLGSIWQQWNMCCFLFLIHAKSHCYTPENYGWMDSKKKSPFFEKENHYVQIYRKNQPIMWGNIPDSSHGHRNLITLPKTNLFPWIKIGLPKEEKKVRRLSSTMFQEFSLLVVMSVYRCFQK